MFHRWIAAPAFAVLVLAGTQNAAAEERLYVMGATLDLVAGGIRGTNVLGVRADSSRSGSGLYQAFPAVQFRAVGMHSSLDLSYAFGASRSNSGVNFDSNSHGLSAAFTKTINPEWQLTATNTFQAASNFVNFNSTRGVASDPENFVFNPLSNRSTVANTAAVHADYVLSESARLSFGASHSYLDYPNSGNFRGFLSTQQRISENVSYSYKANTRTTWVLNYTGAYSDFRGQFENAHTHTASAGFSQEIGRDLTFQFSAGPSYVRTKGVSGNYSGYNVQARLQKPIKSNTLSVYYAHDAGQSPGLGSISDNDRAGLSLSRSIGKDLTLFADVSGFDIRGRLGNAFSTRGWSTAANLGIPIANGLSLRWGGQYQRQSNNTFFEIEQTRIYLSLRFSEPEFWKAAR